MKITRKFTFDAAHHLTQYHGKCEKPHGHTYQFTVTIEGEVAGNGLVMDFAEFKKIVDAKILKKLDHTDLNDLFENPSAENIAKWIWDNLAELNLVSVQLWESEDTSVIYEGN